MPSEKNKRGKGNGGKSGSKGKAKSIKTKREVRREQLHNNYNVRRKNKMSMC